MQNKLNWYLPHPENKEPFGPFTQDQITEMYDKGQIFIDDFIWAEHLKERKWYRVYECSELSSLLKRYPSSPLPKIQSKGISQQMKAIHFEFKKGGEYGKENIFRRYPRVPLSAEVVIHNQEIYTKSTTMDISEKGLSIQVDNTSCFQKGDEVTATVINSPFCEAFSVKATIIRAIETPFKGYGLYFLMVKPQTKRLIAQYVIEQLRMDAQEVA